MTPQSFRRRYPAIDLPDDLSNGWFAGATIEVADLAKAKTLFDLAKIKVSASTGGGLVVDPKDAVNTVIEFIPAK